MHQKYYHNGFTLTINYVNDVLKHSVNSGDFFGTLQVIDGLIPQDTLEHFQEILSSALQFVEEQRKAV